MYTHILYIRIHLDICMYTHVYMYIYIYIYIYIRKYTYIYIYICVYVCVCACIYIYTHMYIYTHTHTHQHTALDDLTFDLNFDPATAAQIRELHVAKERAVRVVRYRFHLGESPFLWASKEPYLCILSFAVDLRASHRQRTRGEGFCGAAKLSTFCRLAQKRPICVGLFCRRCTVYTLLRSRM